MLITKWMKKDLVTASPEITVREAVKLFIDRKVGILPIIEPSGKFIGAVTLRQIIKLFMPAFFDSINRIGCIEDFGALEEFDAIDESMMDKPIKSIIKKNIPVVSESHSVFSAMNIMNREHLYDLIVTDGEKLAGLVSMVDIGVAFLSKIQNPEIDE